MAYRWRQITRSVVSTTDPSLCRATLFFSLHASPTLLSLLVISLRDRSSPLSLNITGCCWQTVQIESESDIY